VKVQEGRYDLSPAKLRQLFVQKGWSRVVGFHSRNVVHRAHEAIQLMALEKSCADGLLISPVLGAGKKGDFLPEVILDCYQAMLDNGFYPEGKAVLAGFSTYPRFSGPREAVFTTLCRKNMGCSHMVIGRDHTGVGKFYDPYAAHRLLEQMGDLGITPVFFDAVGYHAESDSYRAAEEGLEIQSISGTQVRRALCENTPLPDWAIRNVVQDVIRHRIARKQEIFAA
jgi:ATP sulfurylase